MAEQAKQPSNAGDSQSTPNSDKGFTAGDGGNQNGAGQLVEIETENGEIVKVSQADLVQAYQKKITNADRLLTKKSQELTATRKSYETKSQELDKTISDLKEVQKSFQQMKSPDGGETFVDKQGREYTRDEVEEVKEAIRQQISAETSKFKDEIDGLKKQVGETQTDRVVREVSTKTDEIVSEAGLPKGEDQKFLFWFMGKYDVEGMPREDTVDEDTGREIDGLYSLLRKEATAWTKDLKQRGLMSDKKYVDDRMDKNKRLGTDNLGTGGRDDGKMAPARTQRENRMIREDKMREIVARHLDAKK